MAKTVKKQKKITKEVLVEIANEVTERAGCFCDIELADKKLRNKIYDLFTKHDVPYEVGLATLKDTLFTCYLKEAHEDRGLEFN